jgi:hypothetical protein
MAGSGHHGATQTTYTTEDVMLQLDSIQSTKPELDFYPENLYHHPVWL